MRKEKKYEKVAGINKLSLSLKNKEITALIGSNGSGKTTLFNIINGLLAPHSGKIIFYNGEKHDLMKLSPWRISRVGLGRMFQDDHIWENLTVMENLIAGDENTYGENPIEAIFNRKRIKETEKIKKHEATQLLQRFFRDDKKFWAIDPCKRLASGLSGGQQKIVGLLRLMMGDYKLVLIDEPTASIDKTKIGIITEIIKEMK